MPNFQDIPATVDEVLDDGATFDPAALAAVKAFARSKPWQGSDEEKLAKFNRCAAELATAYNFQPWTIKLGPVARVNVRSCIFVMDKLSVVTFLNLMATVRGQHRRAAYRWSINIFKRCFPRSFAACRQDGPFLLRGL